MNKNNKGLKNMKKNKKAVEMSLNTVIMAVIVLIILAILLYFLGGTSHDVKKGLECTKQGGRCTSLENHCDYGEIGGDDICGPNNHCCKLTP